MSTDYDSKAIASAEIAEYLFMRAARFVEQNTKYNGEYKLNAILNLTDSMATTFAGLSSSSFHIDQESRLAEATRAIDIKTLK